MQRKFLWSLLSFSVVSSLIACTAGDPAPQQYPGTSGAQTTAGTTTDPTTTAGTTSTAGTTTAGTTIGDTTGFDITTGDMSTGDTAETGDTTMVEKEVECQLDAQGNEVCMCIKIATWGALGTYGAVPGMDGQDAIAAWLNENSTGTADYIPNRPAITPEFLAFYDIILIQDISMWTAFTAEEKTAFEAWVNAGGGVISLQGYQAEGTEVDNVNDLLNFTGMQYAGASDTANEEDRTDKLDTCDYCYGSSVPQGGWIATHPIAANMKEVGAYHGRAVVGGDPVAKEFGATLGATVELGMGHVFMFHDEWVTYNSQWDGQGIEAENDCRDLDYAGESGECLDLHPAEDFSVAQFWYNALVWVSSDRECFVIEDETIIPIIRRVLMVTERTRELSTRVA